MSEVQLNEAWRLHRAGDFQKAAHLYRDIIRADPRNYEALRRLGFLHGQCGQWEEAQYFMGKAIEVNPASADAYLLRGTALQRLMRHEDAVFCFDRAVGLNPNFAEARLNRASALFRLRRYEDAAAEYGRLIDIDPDYPFALGNRLFCQMQVCDWHSLDRDSATILTGLRAGKRIVAPFDSKALSFSAEDELICAHIWTTDQYATPIAPLYSAERYRHEKIRVAYLSADFRESPVASLLAGVFESHDSMRFEIIGVSLGPDDRSTMRARLQRTFAQFIDAKSLSDFEIASRLKQMEIDIAVDLMGFTEGCRPGIFKLRPAPIQVNYLGYPGSLGTDFHDYIIADLTIIPEEARHHYAEKIVHLPSFMPRDTGRGTGFAPSRAEAGLPEEGFIFAAFNNTYKITPRMFDIWMRLLSAVPGSVLWMTKFNSAAIGNLVREAGSRGIEAGRLVFAPFLAAPEDHFARLSLADLFLDTLPYNAHSTASDALWAGVPVLTCLGETFAGRVAASLLHAVGLPELVSKSVDEYEVTALALARNPVELHVLRANLKNNRRTQPLFDTTQFTRNLEAAFATMWKRQERGEAPSSFAIEPQS